jgi:hypothetical protein
LLRRLLGILLLVIVSAMPAAQAHETGPAYLELKETAPGQYRVLWRTPVLSGMQLPLVLQMPKDVRNLRDLIVQELTDSLLERRRVDAEQNGLAGKCIEFPGYRSQSPT